MVSEVYEAAIFCQIDTGNTPRHRPGRKTFWFFFVAKKNRLGIVSHSAFLK